MSRRPLSTRLLADDAWLEVEAAELRVVAGPDRGTRTVLGTGGLCVGSAPDCQLVLHDSTVSARHAEIVLGPTSYEVRDLGSKNGIRLGKWRVSGATLADGMRLQLGESAIAVRALGRRDRIALASPGLHVDLTAYSVKMRALVALLEQLGPAEMTVLIEGETGVGKEVVAHALHRLGPRASAPFVIFDCGAQSTELARAALFGHEPGAFTGATEARAGLFEEADGGILFLDEIGELPLELQPMLLRAIEHKRTRRLGDAAEVAHDVRVVAATHRNLAEEVREKRFRADLFHRLAVARVHVPPLRERPEDIPVLADRFARELGVVVGPELVALLAAHRWPGNVRELRNAVVQATVPSSSMAALPASGAPRTALPLQDARRAANEAFERIYLERLLEQTEGNLSRAADAAGVSRQLLTRMASKHGLRRRDRGD